MTKIWMCSILRGRIGKKVDLAKGGKGDLLEKKKTVQQVVVDSDVYVKSSLFHAVMFFRRFGSTDA